MQVAEQDRFNSLLNTWAAGWPTARFEPRHHQAYWSSLSSLPFNIVRDSLVEAGKEKAFVPSASEVRGVALRLFVRLKGEEDAKERAKRDAAEALAYRNPAPVTEDGMREYVNDAVSPFEKLARLWECESKAMNISSSAPTQKEVFKKRIGEFWRTWEKYGNESTPGRP